ncbi:twin-arginine translocation pathway signal [Pusillimonas sp. TS35]|uniref:BPSL1445 family SYLF domain-containing lipoprotein n=1 Tax=Paracandidimonas lactea TaxID=2895524 RepID=UPI001370364E|nr:YSC84-related protein [Paracandidimonas lactea]MYN12565.1 twin-arginine translocation pathway signal [Pusillimonas sp. TS35]
MSSRQLSTPRKVATALAFAVAGMVFSGCTTTAPDSAQSTSERRAAVDSRVDATLQRLYEVAPAARAEVANAKGVLIFPKVLSAGFIVGGEHGDGVLRVGGRNEGYYSTTSGSFGLQAGAQSKAIVMLFKTQEALDHFRKSNGWKVGADATVAVANIGANGVIDSNTLRQPVVAFVMTNAGLMAGVSLEGTKISKL